MQPLQTSLTHAARVAIILMLSACTAGPDYHTPSLHLPSLWSGMGNAPADKVKPAGEPTQDEAAAWWTHFNDDALNALLAEAEHNNHDLSIAAQRVREARAQHVATSAALFPEVKGAANDSRGNAQNIFNGKPFSLYDANFDASWEIDLFGGNQRKAEAASASAEETEAQARGTLMSLRAEVARSYMELRNLQQQLRITRQTARAEEETWKLTKEMREAGTVSGLDVEKAKAQYSTSRAKVPDLEAQESAAKNQLAVLLGRQPEALDNSLDEEKPVPVADRAVVVDTPANVIARRPDIKAAERELAAKTALQGAAIADLYPKISISALLGDMHSTLFSGYVGKEWQGAGGLTAPIFNAGRIRANINASDAQAQAALDNYQQAALKALAEVETTLTNYLKEDEKRGALKEAADAAAHKARLARERYKKGADPFISVLDAIRASFEAQGALAASEAAVAKNLVALYKALGV